MIARGFDSTEIDTSRSKTLVTMETDVYSKRVYQGVRVKHTVKDLLAEKRSRQTNGSRYNGGTSPPQSAFVQMPGSHMLPGYYGMRRPFISDTELCHSTKPFSPEGYPPTLGSKALSCDPTAMTGYPSFMDGYYPESLGDYRSSAFSTGGTLSSPRRRCPPSYPPSLGTPPTSSWYGSPTSNMTLITARPLPSPHLARESWEQNATDAVNQTEVLCSDGLATAQAPPPAPPSLTSPETTSPNHYRTSGRGSGLSTPQSYSLHSLDDAHYPTSYAPTPSYMACPSYMTTPIELTSKMAPLPSEDSDTAPPSSDTLSWAKDDGSSSWSSYEVRRAY
ncbi:hypothetical protein MATL_G00044660 [Megalops atlanticus]|uniref:OCA domain-containing protein n=1 Tax=Megalops atlanticus TaxID=7932 RepID=A0A9D3TEJ5_MEGAT|nr:hypothetical protein MATL_G00044660 [Megalops atlanticus]